MTSHPVNRLFLIGLPGCGKTTIGRRVAGLLGWSFLDLDALVEERAGASVARLFAEQGEAHFRTLETSALAEAAHQELVVVATGGGTVCAEANRALLRASGWRVWLDVEPRVALARLETTPARNGTATPVRPLLAGADPLRRLEALRVERTRFYEEADDTVVAGELSEDAIARRVAAGIISCGLVDGCATPTRVLRATHPAGVEYDAVVAWGGLATLGDRLHALDFPPRLHIVSDATVGALFGPGVLAGLRRAGFEPELWTMPAGEAHKNRAQLDRLYDWLAERRAERREAVLALGGGVVGDLAGFAAATYLRGVPLVQVPTSLLAQVDASIGGKVGIDHPRGKNLLGAFHQPALVLADPATLLTLPARTYIEGLAEAIKHGVVLDAPYFAALETDVVALLARDPTALTAAVAGSVALKLGVVQGDEREREDGRRQLLNYGHTIGHALETVTGYGQWLHGEAVAVGMAVAARVGQRLGLTPPAVVARQDALLAAFGLPGRLPPIPATRLMRAALWDKKVRGGRVRWIVATALGSATAVEDVPDEVVRAVLVELGARVAPDTEEEE